jgi:hypothetical protein
VVPAADRASGSLQGDALAELTDADDLAAQPLIDAASS